QFRLMPSVVIWLNIQTVLLTKEWDLKNTAPLEFGLMPSELGFMPPVGLIMMLMRHPICCAKPDT
ncbi:hypothetical protein L9F63_011014, partial [Diploptera punctata]